MKTYQQTKSLECEASLISLKELTEKKKDGEVADGKQYRRGSYLYPTLTQSYPITAKHDPILRNKNYSKIR